MKLPERRKHGHSIFILLIPGAAIALASTNCFALKSDHSQPIHIEADSVNVDEKNGTSFYQGNVQLSQGSMKVSADTIRLTTQAQKVHLINAKGTPAHFEQLPDGETDTIKATAEKIDYDAVEGQLVLKTNAQLVQGTNEFSSETIRYATQESQVIATSEGDTGGRVRAVINPEKIQ